MIPVEKEFMSDLFDISGKVALITGGTGALGAAIAKGYAYAGAKLLITARNEQNLKDVTAELQELGAECAYVVGDPSKEEDCKRIVNACVETYGCIDILVTAAGLNIPHLIQEQPLEEFQKIQDANVVHTWLFAKYVGEVMINQGRGGKMILVSSARSKIGMKNYVGYGASKAAVDLITQSVADEYGQYGINVNSINPTVFRSDLTAWMFEDGGKVARERFLSRIPLGRLGEPRDFVGICILLASKAGDFITGANIATDGGYWAN